MTTVGDMQRAWKQERARIEDTRETLEKDIRALQNRIDALPACDGDVFIRRLGEAVTARMSGMDFEVAGPQGIDCIMRLIFTPDGRRTYASLSFRPTDEGTYRLIDYSRTVGDLPPGSIGAMNGMNYPDVEIPDSIDDLVTMVDTMLGEHRARLAEIGRKPA